jgi:hypothetical protein
MGGWGRVLRLLGTTAYRKLGDLDAFIGGLPGREFELRSVETLETRRLSWSLSEKPWLMIQTSLRRWIAPWLRACRLPAASSHAAPDAAVTIAVEGRCPCPHRSSNYYRANRSRAGRRYVRLCCARLHQWTDSLRLRRRVLTYCVPLPTPGSAPQEKASYCAATPITNGVNLSPRRTGETGGAVR